MVKLYVLKIFKFLIILFTIVLVSCGVKINNNNNETDIGIDSKKSSDYSDKYVKNFLSQIDESKLVKMHSRDSSIDGCESILFGKYEIDGNLSNGLENIEWVLLDINKDNNEAILISKYVLDYKPYVDVVYALKNEYKELNDIYNSYEYYKWLNVNIDSVKNDVASIYGETSEKISWETSTLREWLNKDFYNTAFSKDEKSIIKSKELLSKRFVTEYHTIDNVFCIDVNDLERYFNCDDEFNEMIRITDRLYYTKSTKFANKVLEEVTDTIGVNNNKSSLQNAKSNYWFRSMNTKDAYTSMMSNAGLYLFAPISHREKCAANVESRNIGVRPAICVDLDIAEVIKRYNEVSDDSENIIHFDKKIFGNKKFDKETEMTIREEDIDYYYTGGEW